MPALALRLAVLGDAEQIRQIYNTEVTESVNTFDLEPRSLDDQRRWLADRSGAHAVVVALDGDDVVGFASLSEYRSRPAYRTSVENSVYVHRDHHGEGVGRALLNELISLAKQHGFHAMFARIVGNNPASIALHERAGFRAVGVEREVGRKFGKWLDVVVMQLLL